MDIYHRKTAASSSLRSGISKLLYFKSRGEPENTQMLPKY